LLKVLDNLDFVMNLIEGKVGGWDHKWGRFEFVKTSKVIEVFGGIVVAEFELEVAELVLDKILMMLLGIDGVLGTWESEEDATNLVKNEG